MHFLQECGVRSYGELGQEHFGILPAGISKIGIKQHLLIEHVHGTSFVAMVTHQCKQQVESS